MVLRSKVEREQHATGKEENQCKNELPSLCKISRESCRSFWGTLWEASQNCLPGAEKQKHLSAVLALLWVTPWAVTAPDFLVTRAWAQHASWECPRQPAEKPQCWEEAPGLTTETSSMCTCAVTVDERVGPVTIMLAAARGRSNGLKGAPEVQIYGHLEIAHPRPSSPFLYHCS